MASWAARLMERAARLVAGWPLPLPSQGECCVCGATVAAFLPYRADGWRGFRVPALMEALGMVGSDVQRFSCPRCLSHDRERHLMLYMRAAGLEQRLPALRILHMAPEAQLSRLIAARQPALYVRGDLFPTEPGVARIDLQAIPHADAAFDLVIANHVLEHVDDDQRALREIARVLAPGGHAVLQTPYAAVLEHTFEDPGIRSPAARLQAYGQEDHVRLYGRDIFKRFAMAGLEDCHLTHEAALPGVDAFRYAVNAAEPLFLFRKPAAR